MITNKNIRGAVQHACESLEKIQDMLMESAWTAAKSEETTAWQDAETLFRAAKEVNSFKHRLQGLSSDSPPELGAEPQERHSEIKGGNRMTAHTENPPQKRKISHYPKYIISDNCLVKIGLKRNRRTEYKHIVQKAAFEKIASVIAGHLIKDKEFAPESIMADLNLPGYQTYIVLALLRKVGLLKIPRRGLYTATHTQDFVAAASDVWNKLSSRGMQKNDNN